MKHATRLGARRFGLVLAAAILLAAASAGQTAAHPIDPNWSPPRTVYIPATGQTIDGLFLDLWHDNGGALTFGNPVTPEVGLEDGRVVQYYEYARFEYWPSGDENGNLVRLGNVGDELRPVVVPRRMPARTFADAPEEAQIATTSGISGSTAEIAQMIRAWLPLTPERIAPDSPSYRYVPAAGHSIRLGFKAFWEATGEAAYLGNPLSEEYALAGTVYQVFERGQLAWREGIDPFMVPIGNVLAERYGLETAPVDPGGIPAYSPDLFTPPTLSPGAPPAGPVPGAAKTIVVSLGQQSLWALEGDAVVMSTFVSTGKERYETPTGTFYVNSKVPIQDMEGTLLGEYYFVEDVPSVMYFTDVGHAIHGTWWHDNFGTPMSHGCINLPLGEAEWLFAWAPTGTPVVIVP